MAADDIARGALHLIRWGKKLVPAAADEIERFGPNAARVRALLNFIPTMSDDAAKISSASRNAARNAAWHSSQDSVWGAASSASRNASRNAAWDEAWDKAWGETPRAVWGAGDDAASSASSTETVSDLITPEVYRTMTNPMAAARRFDMTVPNAPESFTNAARTLGERGLVTGPKDIELARRISMLPPHIQDVYFNLLQEGSDPMEMLAAMKLLG